MSTSPILKKKMSKPVPLCTSAFYDFRCLTLDSSELNLAPFAKTIRTRRNLITRWDLAATFHFEDYYLDTVFDDTTSPFESFAQEDSPTLTSFFATNMIDIPFCLKKMKFAHSSLASSPKLRLISILSRHGKRATISKFYAKTAKDITHTHFSYAISSNRQKSWESLYTLFAQRKVLVGFRGHSTPRSLFFHNKSELYNRRNELFNSTHRWTSDYNWFSTLLTHELTSQSPTFSFFVQSVNKLKRRHSRGKSGKYEIIWKYVPKYKRILTVLRWLAKDIQFQKSKTLQQRIFKSFETLLLNRTGHLVHRLRQFVHKFVFHRYRKTLLSTLHTAY